MRNTLYTLLYIISLAIAGFSVHQAFAQHRSPSVEPLAEIEIGAAPSKGYDFAAGQKRIPAAAIRVKEESTKYSTLGPILFFALALPFAIWMLIAKKFGSTVEEKKSEYYSNTYQFTPYKTEYQKQDNDSEDDDIDYSKSA